jgi:hypothetical protein
VRRALHYAVVALAIAAAITACGNGAAETNPPVALEQFVWVPLEQLAIPTPLFDKGVHAIMVGQFAVDGAADGVRERVQALDLPSSIIPVVDTDGSHWFVVSAGSFESLDEARTSRPSISQELNFNDPPPLMMLPQ